MIAAIDSWQRRTRWAGVPYAVVKKFGDDNANLLVVALAWYGFTAIFPLLLAKLTMYAAELNPVLARKLYPRALVPGGEPTAADQLVLADLVHAQQRRDDQVIGVGFGDHAADQAASDATRRAHPPR